MKRLLTFGALFLCSLLTFAESFTVDGICYNILSTDDKTVEVTSGGNYTGEIEIPATVTYNNVEYCVTSIGDDAFRRCTNLTSITIPNSVTIIGRYAFYGCSGLTLIPIPNSVTSIGNYAFEGTAWYNNQPDGLVYAGKVAYKYKGTIPDNTNVILEDGTLGIAKSAFSGCSGLTSITIPNSVTSIGDDAFLMCTGLTSVTIPNSVTSIGKYAFGGCSGLTSITIPNSVTSIGNYAFEETAWYNNQPDGLVYAGKVAYQYKGTMPANTTIILDDGTLVIADYALYNCSNLSSITIPNSVTNIGRYAFYGCSNLTSITIPNSVTSIGEWAFYSCSGLTLVSMGNGVTSIENKTFSHCSALNSITIPNSVTSIEYCAFGDCFGLTSVSFGSGMKNIGRYAFINCSGLTSITFPSNVTNIGESAFNDCSGLTSITIPNSVTSIGYGAFCNCSGLNSVLSEIEDPYAFGADAFENISNNCVLTVPAGKREAYIENGWTTGVFKGGIIDSSDPTTIYLDNGDCFTAKTIEGIDMTFQLLDKEQKIVQVRSRPYSYYGSSITAINNGTTGNITIPEKVVYGGKEYLTTSIGSSAFYDCSGLTSITIPNSVTNIGNWAFQDCSGLTSITIPNSVTSIGDYAFNGCSGLTSVTIPNSVTSIGELAFYGCTGLTSITIPNSVTSAGRDAFDETAWYNNLPDGLVYVGKVAYKYKGTMPENTSIVLEDGTVRIGYSAFEGCTGLISITIPTSVTSIGESAFSGCSGLTSITIPNSVTSIESSAFVCCYGLIKAEFASIESLCNIRFGNDSSNPLLYAKHLYINGTEVKDVIIPDGTTNIPDFAFKDCTALTSIIIPNSVISIGESAFESCSELTSINIGSGVTTIGKCFLKNCPSLTTITVDEGNTLFDSHENCNAIIETATKTLIAGCKNTVIPINVEAIGENAFFGCSGLTTITIPEGVTSIGSSAFFGCSSLTSITIPESVTSIGSSAFRDCSSLIKAEFASIESLCNIKFGERDSHRDYWNDLYSNPLSYAKHLYINGTEVIDLVIPESVTSIGDGAFAGCSQLTSVTIHENVESIGTLAFSECTGLNKAEFASIESLCNIKFGDVVSNPLFYAENLYINGTEITDVVIPNSVTSIGNNAFAGCSGITSIIIPSGVTRIGDGAFSHCWSLSSISIPNSVTRIGKSAFDVCSSLTSITIPNSVTSIGDGAFWGCSSLTSITIPNSVTSIERYAFDNCSGLTDVIIGNGVGSIGDFAFYDCPELTSVKVHRSSPIRITSSSIFPNRTNSTLYVPLGSKAAYEAKDIWKDFKTIVEFIDGDVNQDSEVDVVDVVDIARYVVGTPANTFKKILAEINFDGIVNIADAVALVNELVGNQRFAKELRMPKHINANANDQLTLNTSDDGSLSLVLENQREYTAFQFDLYVPTDMDIIKIALNSQRKQKHQLLYNKVKDGHYRVAAVSTSNHAFLGSEGELLSLMPEGIANGVVTISNIHFITADGTDYRFNDISHSETTGIESLTTPPGSTSSQSQTQEGNVYDLSGRKIIKDKMTKGIYIINGKKVVVE